MCIVIEIYRASRSATHAAIRGGYFGGLLSATDLREMATPEFAAKCTRLADEIEGPVRAALRDATRDSESAIARVSSRPTKG
jgi:hypothetical protein